MNIQYAEWRGIQLPLPFFPSPSGVNGRLFKRNGNYTRTLPSGAHTSLTFPVSASPLPHRSSAHSYYSQTGFNLLASILNISQVPSSQRRGTIRAALNDVPPADLLSGDVGLLQSWIDQKLVDWAAAVELELCGPAGQQEATTTQPAPAIPDLETDPDLEPEDGGEGDDDDDEPDEVDLEGLNITVARPATTYYRYSGFTVDTSTLAGAIRCDDDMPSVGSTISNSNLAALIRDSALRMQRHDDLELGSPDSTSTDEDDGGDDSIEGSWDDRLALINAVAPALRRAGLRRDADGTWRRVR